MMIVVQRLAARQERPISARKIAGVVRRLKIPIAPPVTEPVDHPRRKKWDPRHFEQPHRQTPGPEQPGIRSKGDDRSEQTEWLIQPLLQEIVWRPFTVLRH